MKTLFVILAFYMSSAFASDITIVMPGKDYGKYSNDELRMRIWNLEKAVMQLQQKVFALELGQTSTPGAGQWTCMIKSFGKTFTSTAPTKMKAMADVVADCSKATNAVHCDEDEVKCGQ